MMASSCGTSHQLGRDDLMQLQLEDRLSDHDTTDSLWNEIEDLISELYTSHYERLYEGDVCETCLRDIPMDERWGPMSDMADEVEMLAERAQERFDELGDGDEEIKPAVRGQYIDSYHEQAVEPADCAVCTAEIVAEDVPCGHWMEYETCPVRGEPP